MLRVDLGASDADRKFTLKEEKYNATNFLTLWDFEGVFKYSPLFYGWYTNNDSTKRFYRLPIAYFVTGLLVYAYSFFATLRKMAENSRMSKLSEKDDEYIFSWKLFTAWDYMIGNAETAHNRVAAIVMGFKEALLEEAEKKRESRNWKIVCFRVLANILVLALLFFSAFAVIMVVKRSTENEANSTVWRKNEITVVLSLISLFFPMLFEVLGLMEQYHPRKQLRLQLARIMVLNLLNLYSLIFALFDKISIMTNEQQHFKHITCTDSTMDQKIDPNGFLYYNGTNIFDDTRIMDLPKSESLVYNISDDILTPGRELLKVINELNITNNTLFDSITNYYLENSFLLNITNNISSKATNLNLSLESVNEEVENLNEYNLTDFKELFTDYLSYILNTLIISNDTDSEYMNNTQTDKFENVTFSTPLTADSNNNTDIEYFSSPNNITDFNITFESFLSHMLNLLNNSLYKVREGDTLNNTINDNKDIQDVVKENFSGILSDLKPWLENISAEFDLTTQDDTKATEFSPLSLPDNIIPTENSICEKTNTPINSVSTTISPTTSEMIVGNYSMCAKLRSLCWETMFGQELIKLTVMDLIMTILSTLAMDFFRGIFVRFMNRCWCWDLEKKFPQYGDFKVAENILHLVNNQGMVWMGMFFSPGLVVLNVIKLYIMMYFRAWAVLTCNVPHEVIFRASRSNNFYYALLLMMLFLCVLPVGYAIVWIKPSQLCGPFSKYQRIFHIFTEAIRNTVPAQFHKALEYIASPGIVIPLLLLLVLIIYYLVSLTGALREANEDLKIQLRRERTEERRKMFQIADRSRGGDLNDLPNTPFAKWKQLLGTLPSGKSFDDTPRQQSKDVPRPIKEEKYEKNKDFLKKFLEKALGKSTTPKEEQNVEDSTDTEQHDSLPYDAATSKQLHKSVKPSLSWGSVSGHVSQMKSEIFLENNTDSVDLKNVPLQHRDTFEIKRKTTGTSEPSTSKYNRQESTSSIPSDNIPMITISKTESAENILKDTKKNSKFKPRIKCALKKQSAELDEDTICHFNMELERNLKDSTIIKTVAEENLDNSPDSYHFSDNKSKKDYGRSVLGPENEPVSDFSSSEDTAFKEDSGTILNFPGSKPESPSEEKTITDDNETNRDITK